MAVAIGFACGKAACVCVLCGAAECKEEKKKEKEKLYWHRPGFEPAALSVIDENSTTKPMVPRRKCCGEKVWSIASFEEECACVRVRACLSGNFVSRNRTSVHVVSSSLALRLPCYFNEALHEALL